MREHAVKRVEAMTEHPGIRTLLDFMDQETADCFGTETANNQTRTSDHCIETAVYVADTMASMKLDKQTAVAVTLGALLHDTGKGDVPLRILNKSGRLSSYDMEVVRDHPVTSAIRIWDLASQDTLSEKPEYSPEQWDLAIAVAALHHRYKSNYAARYPGYRTLNQLMMIGVVTPHSLLLAKRLGYGEHVSICDAYSAIGSNRAYLHDRLTSENLPLPEDANNPMVKQSIIEHNVRREIAVSAYGDIVLKRLADVSALIPHHGHSDMLATSAD